MPVNLLLPPAAAALLAQLHGAGYSAYVVGGCVRDSLLGRTPGDWDICTSALPEQMKALFAADKLVLTGEKHGTVTVIRNGQPYEITTYRLDGAYSDNRRPDTVHFVPDVRADLARRDFTVNAMAWSPGAGLVDAFGGQLDLAARRLRCVGDAAARFGEDALRVLRALRFAAQLDFTLEETTAAAALALRDTVQHVAAERIYAELDRLLASPAAGRVLAAHGAILAGALPAVEPCLTCTKPGRRSGYNVWQHTAQAVAALDAQTLAGLDDRDVRVVRWATLLHDMAKPACRSVDKTGRVTFRGHNRRGAELAQDILHRLKAPAYLLEGAPALVAVHDMPLPGDEAGVLRLLARYGPRFLQRLCALKAADLAAHAPTPSANARKQELRTFAERLSALAEQGCYTVARLKVTGGDALKAGIAPGPAVGRALHTLLEAVMDGRLPNERPALLAALAQMAGSQPA